MTDPALNVALFVRPDDTITVKGLTRSADPFVTLDLGGGVLSLYLSEVETVDQLMAAVAQARRLLVDALGEDPGVVVHPVANPHLTPGSLPVGVS